MGVLRVALFLLAIGCGDEDGDDLDGRTFLLQSAQGFQPVAGSTVRLSFMKDQLGFSAGCNSFSGAYRVENDQLVVASLGGTERGCEPPLQHQDEVLVAFMTSSPRLTLEGNTLTLSSSATTLVFLDREVADPDLPLVETHWSVDTLIKDGAASNLPLASDPTILFRQDGSLQVDTTCNTGSGRYQVAANQLTLTNVTYTEKACSGASASADSAVQEVLRDGTLTFSIEAHRLTLLRGNVGLSAIAP